VTRRPQSGASMRLMVCKYFWRRTRPIKLAQALLDADAMPRRAAIDAAHVAVAAVHGKHFLLTWNCTHIANAVMRRRIEAGVPRCRSRATNDLHAGTASAGGERMIRDPIVEQVRAARDAIAKEHDYDLASIFDALREMARKSGGERVRLPPRRTTRHQYSGAAQPDIAADGASRRS
jgi:hypothetical protein